MAQVSKVPAACSAPPLLSLPPAQITEKAALTVVAEERARMQLLCLALIILSQVRGERLGLSSRPWVTWCLQQRLTWRLS